jgi:hypothetical protein
MRFQGSGANGSDIVTTLGAPIKIVGEGEADDEANVLWLNESGLIRITYA